MSRPMVAPNGGPSTVEVLGNVIGPEFSYYHNTLQATTAPLVVKLGGGVISRARIEQTCSTISTLDSLGLPMVLVHGGGEQINTGMEHAGMEPEWVDGYRVTNTETLGIVRRVLGGLNTRLVANLRGRGIDAVGSHRSIITEDLKFAGDLDLVGEVTDVDTGYIHKALAAGRLPVLSCIGSIPGSNQRYNVNADDAAAGVAKALRSDGPQKVIGLTKSGGLFDEKGRTVPVVTTTNGQSDIVTRLMEDEVIHSGMRPKILNAMETVEILSDGSSVVLTRPEHLLSELFTHKGRGTLVRRGDSIECYQSLNGVDTTQLRSIIESAFGDHRQLSADYFDTLPKDANIFVTAQQYNGVAIVFPGELPEDPAYLDKIAVSPAAQGAGVGGELIDSAARQHSHGLFWRTRANNAESIRWYSSIADRQTTVGEWVVFGMNVPQEKFNDCVQQAVAHASTI